MKRFTLFVLMAGLFVYSIGAQGITRTERTVSYSIRDTADYIGNRYICAWAQHPYVLTFVNGDGSVTVCSSDAKNTYIYEYNDNLKEQKIMSVQKEFSDLGAFTKDDDGNYYFFFGNDSSDKNKENMAMVKYDREGEKINIYKLKALAPNSFDGVKYPFSAGTCRLELAGSLLIVYFARQMYNGHQASYGFVLDKNTFERIDKGQIQNNSYVITGNNVIPYVSHSFNQFILPIENGFVSADHGDAYPRAFSFGKFVNGTVTKKLNAFSFPGGTGQNATYAEMGGLAKTSGGFIFTGTYGREINNPRNLFVLTFDEELKACSASIYLTKYTKNDGHAGHPKIVKVDTDRYLLIWEVFKFSTQSANTIGFSETEYISTYMLLIDEKGKAVSEPRELKGIRLNMNDVLRFNPFNGKAYWAINEGEKLIVVYALEVGG